MKTIAILNIDSANYFKITVPELKDKVNYYANVSQKNSLFDEVTVSLYLGKVNIFILADTLQSIFEELIGALQEINKLPKNIFPGALGERYNYLVYCEKLDEINFSDFWLWSGIDKQVWIYSYENSIYLEISPTYKDLFSDEKSSVEFSDFLKNYKPTLCVKLSKNIIEKWQSKGIDRLAAAKLSS